MPDQSHIGRKYQANGQIVDPDQAKAFAQAIAGSEESFQPDVVPPTFAAAYCLFPTLAQLFGDQEVGINLAGLVHGEQTFEWPNPVRGGDVIHATATIASVDDKRGMTFVGVDIEAIRQSDNAAVCTGRALMIIRA